MIAKFFAAALLCAAPVSAQVVRLEITSREPMNAGQAAGAAGPFELIRGRIHGEVDPGDRRNAIIQDLDLAPRNARGKVEYVATFALAKPVDLAKASRVLVYQVVNRGNGQATANAEGDITLVSGWQGDVIPTATNQTIAVPVARKKDGSPVTGRVIARFFDLPEGAHSAPIRLASLGTPQPYRPADLAEPGATLTWHTQESYAGQQDAKHTVPRADWAFADCESTPWPGRPDPSRLCVKDALRAGRFYELVYTAKDPLVLGVGLAATRDIVSFFRHAKADASGTPNPVAGVVDHTISLGDSQSGNFIRTLQIEAVAKVYAGARARDGRQLYPGWARGSESGWGQYIINPAVPVRVGLFRDWVFENPAWDPRTFDWDKDVAAVDAAWPMLNAISTDYTAFNARGGKLIMYTGLADPVVSPLDTIEYYERVAKANGGLDATRRFFRCFPVPGMAHCGGGSGTSTFDALAALEAWVERGIAPDSIPAARSLKGRVDRTRPLCAWPAAARYVGSGSIDDAASFACAPAR